NSEYILGIDPQAGRSRDELLKAILAELKGDAKKGLPPPLPGVEVEPEQPLAHLISHMLSGVTSPIAIKIYGDDLDVLRRTAEKIRAAISTIPGLTPPVIEAQDHIEELQIHLNADDLAYYGIDREHAAHYVEVALEGVVVSQVLQGQRRFDLLVRLDEPFRTAYDALGRLRLDVPGRGGAVQLGEVADISYGAASNVINRENARRRLVIRCNTQGRDLGSVADDIERRIKERITLPAGYSIELGGQLQSQREAGSLILILGGIAVVGMFLVLFMLYPSARIVLQILNALPTAFIGGVLALWLTQQRLTVAAMVGFISLAGIAARNGILLVSHYFHLMKQEGETFSEH